MNIHELAMMVDLGGLPLREEVDKMTLSRTGSLTVAMTSPESRTISYPVRKAPFEVWPMDASTTGLQLTATVPGCDPCWILTSLGQSGVPTETPTDNTWSSPISAFIVHGVSAESIGSRDIHCCRKI